MVLSLNVDDLLVTLKQLESLSLPVHKENTVTLSYEASTVGETEYGGANPILPFAASDLFQSKVKGYRKLTANECVDKAVYEVTLDIEGSKFKFKPGDTIGVLPKNRPSDIKFLVDHLEITEKVDLMYSLCAGNGKTSKIPAHIPVKSTLRYVLEQCIDVKSVVKKLFLLALSKHTKDSNEKRIMEYLCSKEGAHYYTKHILEPGITILDILGIFKSCKPPIELLLTHLPRLLPRPYSIANSQLADENIIKICFSVIKLPNNRRGLTTGYLEDLILKKFQSLDDALSTLTISDGAVHDKVNIYLRKNMNNFCLPEDHSQSMLLISPGTGVAPFVGFLEERKRIKRLNPEIDIGKSWLFFGCRNPQLDYIYKNELAGYVSERIISRLEVSYSRLENNDVKYVQDLIRKNGQEVVEFLQSGAMVFVCGDLKTIASQVRSSIKACLVQHGGKSEDDAEALITHMEKEKQYVLDIWS